MSDDQKSGLPREGETDLPAPAPAEAPVKAETPPAENPGTVATPQAAAAPAFGTFGGNRGSGLARGKRMSAPAASAPQATPAGYKPTSIEVVTPQSEYKNPFTGETAVSAPRVNEPAPQAAPVPPVAPVAPAAPADIVAPPTPVVTEPAIPAATAVPSPVPESSASLDAANSEQKPELKILPPERPKRSDVRWEAGAEAAPAAPSNRDERPTFRPRGDGQNREAQGQNRDGREGRPGREGFERRGREFRERDNREGGENRAPREPRPEGQGQGSNQGRRSERQFERRDQPAGERRPQPMPPRAPSQPAKSGGFLGWLKGIFGSGDAEAPAAGSQNEQPRREGGGDRNRHRGGRGRGGQGGGFQGERGPRPEGQQGQGGEGGQGEGDFGGRRRRRRRGGRGRFQGGPGGGGDRDPRPEGQQGGGAI